MSDYKGATFTSNYDSNLPYSELRGAGWQKHVLWQPFKLAQVSFKSYVYIVVMPEYDFWESNTLKYIIITFLQYKHKYVLSSDILWADHSV